MPTKWSLQSAEGIADKNGNIRIRLVLFVALMIVSTVSYGDASSHARPGDSKSVFNRTLTPFVSEVNEGNLRSLFYCPDNLCFVFDASSEIEWGRIYDFSLLFLLYESGFPEFVEPGYEMPSKVSPREAFLSIENFILRRYPSCNDGGHVSRVHCVLRLIQSKYGVHAFFVRDDEGIEIKVEQKLSGP